MSTSVPERRADIPLVLVLTVFTACYAPFVAKPFHMDDPLFLWTARQILTKPFDFYGYSVNWYYFSEPAAHVIQNPPLASYYVALAASLFGWSEVALHLAFLLPALAVVVGTYRLAQELSVSPWVAALTASLTPAFLVSSTTVMCDVLMLSGWTWSIALWVRGMRSGRTSLLGASALLASLAVVTKLSAAGLVPLLLVYGVLKERRVGPWALWLLLPVGAVAGLEWAMTSLYGRGLFLNAGSYAGRVHETHGYEVFSKVLTGLIFMGGAYLPVAFQVGRLCSRRAVLAALALWAAVTGALVVTGHIGGLSLSGGDGLRWGIVLQCALLLVIGLGLVALAVVELVETRTAEAVLLLMWIGGILLFATRLNWSVNVRSLLPAAPAVGILVAQRAGRRSGGGAPAPAWRAALPFVPAAIASILVAQADQALACTGRRAAGELAAIASAKSPRVWFQGHWGFQYYAEQHGLQPVDYLRTRLSPGDRILVPEKSTNVFQLPVEAVRIESTARYEPLSWLATMDSAVGAGFYSDTWGPLPFAIGSVPARSYLVLVAVEAAGPLGERGLHR